MEYDLKEQLGFYPSTTIQMSPFDRDTGELRKYKFDETGKKMYYWSFWDYGWFYFEDLRDEAKVLVKRFNI